MEYEEIETVEGTETIDVEEILETVSTGDSQSPEGAEHIESTLSLLTVEGNEETITLLTDILAQVSESNETIQLKYESECVPITEKPIDNLTFTEFILLGIFCLILADFIIRHIGGIFKCMK